MLYHMCENQPKIPFLTFISDARGKPVQKGGRAKGGQGGLGKRPMWQVKTVPDVKKIAAKSKLRSNRLRKVGGEKFSFSACTLVHILYLVLEPGLKVLTELSLCSRSIIK